MEKDTVTTGEAGCAEGSAPPKAAGDITLKSLSGQIEQCLQDLSMGLDDKVAIAVSGGADSMALVRAANLVLPVIALTVDHGLRAESSAEARRVHKDLTAAGIDHITLAWQGDKPQSNIQAEARQARYQLMEAWCVENGVKVLMTGHQRDDLAEGLMMRLMRGSGIEGLAAMPYSAPGLIFPDRITRVRPFLTVRRQALEAVLLDESIPFINDPSNQDDRFARARVRQFLGQESLPGLTVDRLAETAERLLEASRALQAYSNEWADRILAYTPWGSARLSPSFLHGLPEDVGLRVVAQGIMRLSGQDYKPRLRSLKPLFSALKSDDFRGQALGGIVFTKAGDDSILMVREARAMPDNQPLLGQEIYDRRWRIHIHNPEAAAGLTLSPLREDGWQKAKGQAEFEPLLALHHQERLSLPCLFDGESCVAPAVILPPIDPGEGVGNFLRLI